MAVTKVQENVTHKRAKRSVQMEGQTHWQLYDPHLGEHKNMLYQKERSLPTVGVLSEALGYRLFLSINSLKKLNLV